MAEQGGNHASQSGMEIKRSLQNLLVPTIR